MLISNDFFMIKTVLTFVCYLFTINVNSQDLNVEQTLAYINKQLNDKDNKSIEITFQLTTVYNITDTWSKDYSYNIKIDKGVLFVTKTYSCGYVYHPDYSTYENRIYTPVIEEISVPVNFIDFQHDYFSAFENFRCKAQSQYKSDFIIHTKDESARSVTKIVREFLTNGTEKNKKTQKISTAAIEFSNDNLVCDKLRNAFVHLFTLISKDTTYNKIAVKINEDPFAKRTNYDTAKANSISAVNSNSVPMIKSGGVYEVPVIINGALKLNFIFDAGASDVSISPDVALTLIRTGTVSDKDFLGTETYKFADGSTAKGKVFLIKEVQIGNKKVYNVRASISSSIKAPLLLGQSVLNKFGKVTIDYRNSVIIFQN